MFTGSAVIRAGAALALAAGIAAGAQAGSLTITPLAIKLSDSTRDAALTVSNEGGETRVIQIQLVRWTQHNGVDAQAPTGDLLVNPPLATVDPGQSQTIRIGLKRAADSTQELAYRLYVTEVPPPGEKVNGMRVVVRLGVPIYVAPRADASARVHWEGMQAPNGEVVLTLLNDGNRHERIDGFKIVDPGSGRLLGTSQPTPYTLLAGQARRYGLKPPQWWRSGQLKLVTQTADGPSAVQIAVSRSGGQAAPAPAGPRTAGARL